MVSITKKIVSVSKGSYAVIIPKAIVDSGLLTLGKEYQISIEEVLTDVENDTLDPIEEEALHLLNEARRELNAR